MRPVAKEEEMPISPGPNSSVPDIFSTKKIFFLNSCSGSRHSEIPHIESDYCRRDEVSRRLFHHNNDFCDCDCASDGCGGCIRRNKQCFFKFFVLALSIALILLLFGSLSYNLTRNKAADESFDFEKTEWVSHYHEYSVGVEAKQLPTGNVTSAVETEPVLDLPVPIYEHQDDYDSSEDLRKLQYHLDGHLDLIEPISFPPLNRQNTNPQGGVHIIYDGREPPRIKRSISARSKPKESEKNKPSEGFEKPKKDFESDSYENLFEKLNRVEEGMEKFWESYFKKGKTVFEPFSLTTPLHSTPMQSYEDEEEIDDQLKIIFLNQPPPKTFNSEPLVTEGISEDDLNVDQMTLDKTETTTLNSETETEGENTWETSQSFRNLSLSTEKMDNIFESSFNLKELTSDETPLTSTTETLEEAPVTETAVEEETSTQDLYKNLRMDERDFRTWPLFHIPLPFSGLFGSNQQDGIMADSAPTDTVRGISLADAKKIKKERRKHLLLNSRVVGGSSDVRLPTGPDISKPFVNAFETLKTNQQLSFTPSAASQFILPYQMCLFAGSFPGFRPSAHGPQPRTLPFGMPSLIPSVFDKNQPPKNPYQMPAQQNFLSFSINNYPNAPPRQPSGSPVFSFPGQQTFSQFPANKQPIFCTYLQPPLFQFPTVPGTADFSHAKCVDCQEDSQKDIPFAKEIALPSGRETLCSDDKVPCLDGSSCIPVGYWCDNQVHCKDASDEAFCSCRERVARDRLCDGYIDCPHGEDEFGCFDCPKTAFSCGSFVSPDSCIPLSKRCDGVRDCATGADEIDCSALFFHVRQNDSYHVPQVTGFLHHNWKGDWFPVCVEISESVWAKEACLGELGMVPSNVEVRFAPVSSKYKGPFIVRKEDGTVALQDHCKGHVSTFVKCPPMSCGTRIELHNLENFENSYLRDERAALKNLPKANSSDEKKSNEDAENLRLRREETGRVVGGRESEPKAWPWAIAVYKSGAFHCGGVILDEKWVLTAAHCMEQYWKHYYEVRGGMLRRFSFSAMEQARTVSHVIIHENYDLTIMSNDLALLRLREPFHFNRWVRPACLPILQDGISKFASGPAPGTRCTAVGWGALRERGIDPDQLREVEIPIMMRCKHKEDLVGEEICAGKVEGGKDTCQGDSGGPLLCRDSNTPASWYIAGIVSHGEGCARPGEPGAYTRISLFVDWITANANDFQLPSVKPLQACPGFRCRSASKLCIPHKWVCNGYTDCLEAEDERNCTSDSVASNIFNRKYSNEYEFFEEEENGQKSEKISNTNGSLDSGLPVEVLVKKKNHEEKVLKINEDVTKKESSTQDTRIKTTKGFESKLFFEEPTAGLSPPSVTTSSAISMPSMITTEREHVTEDLEKRGLITTEGLPEITFTHRNTEGLNFGKSVFDYDKNVKNEGVSRNNLEGKEGSRNEKVHYDKKTEEAASEEVLLEKKEQSKDEKMFYDYIEEENAGVSERIEETNRSEDGQNEDKKDSEDKSEEKEEYNMRDSKAIEDIKEEESERPTSKTEEEEEEDVDEKEKNSEEKSQEEEKYITEKTSFGIDIYTIENPAINTLYTVGLENTKKMLPFTEKDLTEISFVFLQETETPESESFVVPNTTESESLRFDETLELRSAGAAETTESTSDSATETSELRFAGTVKTPGSTSFGNSEATETISVGTSETPETLSRSVGITKTTDSTSVGTDETPESRYVGISEAIDSTFAGTFETPESRPVGITKTIDSTSVRISETPESRYVGISEATDSTSVGTFETPESRSVGTVETTKSESFSPGETTKDSFSTSGRIDMREIEPLKALETTTNLQHSIRTRETQTYLNTEEYSTLSFGSSTSFLSTDLATDIIRRSSEPDSGYFQCRLIVQSILASYLCDGSEDCEDGTDEENCTCMQTLLNTNPGLVCDGKVHCPDQSDEKNCFKCQQDEFYCKTSDECIPFGARCDGVLDCKYGEDEAKCLALTSQVGSLMEKNSFLETEGFLMTNKNGIWTVKCQEETKPFGAGDAIMVCSELGTIGYERYENRTLASNCTGFHVTCAKTLSRSLKNYKYLSGSYRWPWNAFIYSDGRFVCSAVLLRPQWLLTSSRCLQNISLSKNYLVAKLGSETPSFNSDTKLIRIDGAHLIPESEAALLHLSKEINQTESIRPLGVPYVFESDPDKDVCVAVGDKTVFLKISNKCQGTSRCYKKVASTSSGCTSNPMTGVVVCQSRLGWYPSSVFSEKLGHCGFKQINFTNLKENPWILHEFMDKKVEVFPEPFCSGFRCLQGFCIPQSKKCDGRPDCSAEEDESYEVCHLNKQINECHITELKCRNGRCIPKVLFGDGIQDCGDESDEPKNKTCLEYLRLTAPERICDGKRNCYDKTDEDYKLCSCKDSKFQCKLSGYCVPNDFVCDGEKDCPGGEDEEQCLGRKTVKNHTKTHLEVMQKSYGIWHTMCPSHMTKERSDAFCKDLGFKEALFISQRNQTVIEPEIDPFSWVKLNQKTSIALRGNKPFVKLVSSRKTCDSVKCI